MRALRRTPTFTAVTIVSLGVGLSLVAITLTITDAYLLRELPFPGADRLYHVRYAPPGPYEPRGLAAIDWKALRDVVETPIATGGESFYIGETGTPRFLRGLQVSPGFVEAFGLTLPAG